MNESVNIVAIVSKLLDSEKYKEALSIPYDEEHIENFKENCWEIVSVIIKKIDDDTLTIKPSLYAACEQLLSIILERSTPEEALLVFIEQIELAKNDAQFSVSLTPLQQVLKKLSGKRGRSLEWCFNSIRTYIEGISIPDLNLEEKECLLLDSIPNFRRITKIYSMLPLFYDPFIDEIMKSSTDNTKAKEIVSVFLISLLGKPFIYFNVDPNLGAESEIRENCKIIVKDICKLEKNVLKLLVHVDVCYRESQNTKSNQKKDLNEEDPYTHRDKINITSLSGFFYAILSGHFEIPSYSVPQIFKKEYLIHSVMPCVIHLLSFTEYGPLAKAITLCKVLVNFLDNKTSDALLSSSVHFELCKSLVNVAIYSNYESIRKSAISLIEIHVNKFQYTGRCMLIKYLLDSSNHSGIIGYSITLYKNCVDEAFKEEVLSDCFTGPQLLSMIKKICLLPHGAQSDLVELADQIITALNFLRYLTLKDVNNLSGIRDCFTMIENDYLDPLRTGLNMSKAHYEEKLKEIEEGKSASEDQNNISVTVCGNLLDNIPTKNKKEIIYSALNAFHLIEGLVARLTECINLNKNCT